eukprot:CAMPEP_0184868186 /NCGR_PEP_ID=MMETSP0580-20130426/29515_1 /TAXON_ID=1118495 /ORGANISM="Dactyliosolen fragilissimus" /LENGTH=582 /DNA_ID=CAMNT_0027368925 /DNA_START=291 /DNA_END=2036 /DNA_ORIENTATION=+
MRFQIFGRGEKYGRTKDSNVKNVSIETSDTLTTSEEPYIISCPPSPTGEDIGTLLSNATHLQNNKSSEDAKGVLSILTGDDDENSVIAQILTSEDLVGEDGIPAFPVTSPRGMGFLNLSEFSKNNKLLTTSPDRSASIPSIEHLTDHDSRESTSVNADKLISPKPSNSSKLSARKFESRIDTINVPFMNDFVPFRNPFTRTEDSDVKSCSSGYSTECSQDADDDLQTVEYNDGTSVNTEETSQCIANRGKGSRASDVSVDESIETRADDSFLNGLSSLNINNFLQRFNGMSVSPASNQSLSPMSHPYHFNDNNKVDFDQESTGNTDNDDISNISSDEGSSSFTNHKKISEKKPKRRKVQDQNGSKKDKALSKSKFKQSRPSKVDISPKSSKPNKTRRGIISSRSKKLSPKDDQHLSTHKGTDKNQKMKKNGVTLVKSPSLGVQTEKYGTIRLGIKREKSFEKDKAIHNNNSTDLKRGHRKSKTWALGNIFDTPLQSTSSGTSSTLASEPSLHDSIKAPAQEETLKLKKGRHSRSLSSSSSGWLSRVSTPSISSSKQDPFARPSRILRRSNLSAELGGDGDVW